MQVLLSRWDDVLIAISGGRSSEGTDSAQGFEPWLDKEQVA